MSVKSAAGSRVLRTANAHELIAEVAKGLAGELYEIVMGDNKVRAAWKARFPEATEKELVEKFVAANTVRMLPAARSTLAGMLALDYPQSYKDKIYEALLTDNSLARAPQVPLSSRKLI